MGCGSQFGLLLWKNWLLQKRKVALTIFEIALPTFAALVLLGLKQLSTSDKITAPITYYPFTVEKLSPSLIIKERQRCFNESLPCGWKMAFTPNNTAMHSLMSYVGNKLDMIIDGMAFETEKQMQDFLILEEQDALNTLGGIVVTSAFPNENTFPDSVTYKIRLKSNQQMSGGSTRNSASDWLTTFQFDKNRFRLGPRSPGSNEGGSPGYYLEGFLALQRAVDLGLILQHNASAEISDIDVELQRFPYPPYINDQFIPLVGTNLPFLVMLSFLLLAPNIVKDIVLEKEKKLKESMKLMGLSNWLHWLAWFFKYFIFLTISCILMSIFFKLNLGIGAVINQTDGSLVFITLLLYSIATIMFCFAVSVFFSKANTGSAAGGILFFLSYVPYFVITSSYDRMSLSQKLMACLLPNCAMAMGFNLISQGEASGIGIQWSNLSDKINVDDPLTLGHVLFLFLIDILLAFLITWYVDAVKPGDFGVPKPFYFCCTKWYWCGGDRGEYYHDESNADNVNTGEYFEQTQSNGNAGIQIKGLRKEFKKGGSKKVAVQDLYLNMQEDQITALLGHNGAGKSTTMFMLTGFIPPTRGTAIINGKDIRTSLDKVRSSLGMCPQHDVLFDTLTVEEHLEFFARLKGRSGSEVKKDVTDMIELLHLQNKRNKPSKSLSGGMKRKLSVGIALIGGSKIIILDEPTSGMDPEARRQTWDILQSQRAGRTILLTTHFMDEADYLGDRIAIMSSGKLVCCGSSLFLKKKYGVGYHMTMVKEPNCDISKVNNIITEHVKDAKLESNISAELSYVLPNESSGQFENLFTALETNRKSLGIASFGASVTTMEEVFLKVGESEKESLEGVLQINGTEGFGNHALEANGTDVEMAPVVNGSNKVAPVEVNTSGSNQSLMATPALGVEFRRNSGVMLYFQQYWGMFLKRVINSWRSPIVSIVQLLLPMLFALLSCLILRSDSNIIDPPALTLSFSNYINPSVPYYKNGSDVDKSTGIFTNYLKNKVTLVDVNTQAGGPSLQDYLVSVGEDNKRKYINSYIVAGYFGDLNNTAKSANNTSPSQDLTGYFQNEALHSPALTLNVIGNTLIRYFTNSAQYAIEVINHPLPKPASFAAEEDVQNSLVRGFTVSINVAFGMSFLVATFVVFTIKERNVKAKHCQFVSGVHTSNFWFSAFTWDLMNFLIPALGIMILFVAFDITGYTQGNNLGIVFLTFLMYGASVLPFVYVISFVFDVAASGYVWVTVINILTGITALVVIFILELIESTQDIGKTLEVLFYVLLPNYCFASSLQDIYLNYQGKATCERAVNNAAEILSNRTLEEYCADLKSKNIPNPCCLGNCGTSCANFQDNYLAWDSPGIGKPIFFMFVQFVGFFAFLFFLESGLAKNIMQKIISGTRRAKSGQSEKSLQRLNSTSSPAHRMEDSDVSEERQRLMNTDFNQLTTTDSLIISKVNKYYGDFLAVDGLTVGIKKGECFGLLGVNGAGKTTTFKMLTGDETITSGKAYLDGHSVITDIKKVQQKVGYCPQFDALIDKLTVSETLSMYARLRGVRQSDIKRVVSNLITNLLLEEFIDKQAGTLSGGNKRKLSTAIALVGDPPIVFLDEPTTGMDPVARRHLWNTLNQVTESGRTIVLTSHSMEECEALCTRIAIMVNGQFKCLGGCQRLKNKFGEGYTLMAKVALGETHEETEARTQNLMAFINREFPDSTLKDLHQGLVMYQISDADLSWARIFGTMERAKNSLHIEDYSVSQTTLEQVFINFARAQVPPIEESIKCTAKCRSCCCFFCCCGCCKSSAYTEV